MKKKYIFLLVLVCYLRYVKGDGFQSTLGHIKAKATPKVQAQAAFDVIRRTIADRANEFSIEIDPGLGPEGKDTFKVIKENNTIAITGTTGVAALTGFNYYLKYYCLAHISWEVSQLNLPDELPEVNVTITLNDRFRYYQNVCTTSYSFVWWDWAQWEKHIDWMALNAFNLVLAFNGQEAIWKRVYNKLNLTEDEINEHFTGPAFLSWLRMGNMRGFGGPLSDAWHTRSIDLQKKILARMRSLGIIPVLTAFAGHLPRSITRIYPDANVTIMAQWGKFNDTYCCPYFLTPTEDLFSTIGKMFMIEQIAEFGTDHVYNCDSFNEMIPSSTDLTYIANVSQSIYSAMADVDPDAIWVMQGWLFVNAHWWWDSDRARALLTSVPLGKMIILDLQSEEFPQFENLNQYYGQPYIWCMLHNFGGNLGMFGTVSILNENIIIARNQTGSTMIGTGLTPEGINQNYVVYDLMIESAWRTKPSSLDEWFKNYTIRRYGKENDAVVQAWQKLKSSIYDYTGTTMYMMGQYAIMSRPTVDFSPYDFWYDTDTLFAAWKNFIELADDLKTSEGFLHDLVDITRQVLQVNGDMIYVDLIDAFNQGSLEEFESTAQKFMSIFPDLENILATNKAFLLGPWVESAKACANNSEDENLFEYNARNQITLWGPNGEIFNYATKQWSGLVANYFEPRWKLFIDYMNTTLQNNGTFDEAYIQQIIFKSVEEPFTFDRSLHPTEPKGDAVEIAKNIYKKWHKM